MPVKVGLLTTSIRRLRTASSPPTTSNRVETSTPRNVYEYSSQFRLPSRLAAILFMAGRPWVPSSPQ